MAIGLVICSTAFLTTFHPMPGLICRYVRHKRGDHHAAGKLLEQANVENPTAAGLIQRFAVLRAIASSARAASNPSTPEGGAGPAVVGHGEVDAAAAETAAEQALLDLPQSTLLTPKDLEDATLLALEPSPIGANCLLSFLQLLRAR